MYKKLHYLVRSVFALSCIFSVLFLNTLSVKASNLQAYNNIYALMGNTVVSENAVNYSLDFKVEPSHIHTTYSGGTSTNNGTVTGSSTGSTTGTISLNGGTTSSSPTSSNWQWYGDRTGYLTPGGYSGTYSGSTGTVTLNSSGGSATYSISDSGSFTLGQNTYSSCNLHFKLPINGFFPMLSTVDGLVPSYYYGVFHAIQQNSVSSSTGTIKNMVLTDEKGNLISSYGSYNRNVHFYTGSQLLSVDTSDDRLIGFPMYLEFDYTEIDLAVNHSVSLSFSIYPRIRPVLSQFQSYVGSQMVTDSAGNQLQEKTNSELNDLNATEEDTNETTHSIFDSITDFFGSFFNNLIGVFVPEDGYFTSWFNRVNNLLTDKLGILYYPFSVIIDIFTRLSNALSDSQQNTCVIYLPELGITIQGTRYVFLERQAIDLIDYNIQLGNADTSNSSMFGLTSLIWVVRRFTSLVLVIAFLNMCVQKVKLIMRGSEES